MKWIVFSDSHGSARKMEEVIKQQFDSTDGFLFLGDGIAEFQRLALLYPGRTYICVRGNCDAADDAVPLTEILNIGGRKIFLCHGHTLNVKADLLRLECAAREAGADIALYGHTHEKFAAYLSPEAPPDKPLWILCPGSISRPNSGSPSYGFLEYSGTNVLAYPVEV